MELKKYIREIVETELAEMARISTNIKIGDDQKAQAAKKLFAGTWLEDMIDYVIEAGEVGIPQPDLARKLGKSGQQAINPKVNSFLDSGLFTKGELSVPKKEKSTSNDGIKGRPTSEKVLMAKALNSKFEADSDYEPNEEELAMFADKPEFIENLRMRVMGTLKRGRKLGASKAKDGMVAAMKNVMNTSDEDGDGDVDDKDLDQVNENELNEYGNAIPFNEWESAITDFIQKNLTSDIDEIEMLNDVLMKIIKNNEKYLDQVNENESLNESFNRMQKIAGLIK